MNDDNRLRAIIESDELFREILSAVAASDASVMEMLANAQSLQWEMLSGIRPFEVAAAASPDDGSC